MKLQLRTTKEIGMHPLYTRMNIEGESLWVNLLMNVNVAEWNEVSKSDRKLSNYLNKKGINKKIALIEDSIANMRRYHRLTKENLENSIADIVLADKREELNRAEQLGKDIEERKRRNVRNFVESYFQGIVKGEVLNSKKERFAKQSVKNLGQFRRVFLAFYDKRAFTWEDINEQLVDRYVRYLMDLGYMKNTIDKYISLFKTVISAAERQGLHTNHIACSLLKRTHVREEDKSKKIYLTKDELSALYDMPLSGFAEKVRDVFLIGCFTAMRFSDYSKINKSCIGTTIKGTKVIRICQEKTTRPVVIPIMDERLETLLKKYDYNVPKITDQNLNRDIKKICKKLSETMPTLQKKERTVLTLKERMAETEALKTGTILFEHDEQGYPVKPRWDLVASHTARRSCITNMYLSKKFTIPQIMSVSGHKTEAMLYKYVKLSLDEYADNVASAAIDGLF